MHQHSQANFIHACSETTLSILAYYQQLNINIINFNEINHDILIM